MDVILDTTGSNGPTFNLTSDAAKKLYDLLSGIEKELVKLPDENAEGEGKYI